MHLGEPLRTVIVEPKEIPIPQQEPVYAEPTPQPIEEPVKVEP